MISISRLGDKQIVMILMELFFNLRTGRVYPIGGEYRYGNVEQFVLLCATVNNF